MHNGDKKFELLEKMHLDMIKRFESLEDQLKEFESETRQGISDIKDTLRFILHKEIETEKEIFKLKEKAKHLKDKKED